MSVTIFYQLSGTGKNKARMIKRAQILLMAEQRRHQGKDIVQALSVSTSPLYRTKRDFVEQGLESTLSEGSGPGQARKTDANQEALLVSVACSQPPKGRSRGTLALLAGRFVALTDIDSVSIETIRQRLKDNQLKP